MIYIACALYCEAKPFIEYYHLQKALTFHHFQVFKNEKFIVIITKQGKIHAAIAVTELFHRYPPKKTDFFINIGIAASAHTNGVIGKGYLCNKLIDGDSERTYYPDFIYQNPFDECSLISVSKEFTGTSLPCNKDSSETLIDMEATGIYSAALYFLEQQQLLFFKVISDHGNTKELTPTIITNYIQAYLSALDDFFLHLIENVPKKNTLDFENNELELIQLLSEKLFCSVTMTRQLKQYLIYAKLNHIQIDELLTKALRELEIEPLHSKREGKLYFENFKQKLI